MANNKVVLGNEVLIDLTNDTVSAETLLAGETAHGADGNLITGIATTGGATIVVTYGSDFYGETITCSLGTKTYSKVATSSGEVEFTVDEEGTWTISCLGIIDTVDIELDYESELVMIPDGKTVLPTDDISIWLACAKIYDKDYTTLAEVLEDSVTFNALLGDSNACDYMARSTTWAGAGDAKNPIMTSDSAPSGLCIANSSQNNFAPYYAFNNVLASNGSDGNSGKCWTPLSGDSNNFIGYKFTSPTIVNRITVRLGIYVPSAISPAREFKIQGSNDTTNGTDGTWTDIATHTFDLTGKSSLVYFEEDFSFANNTAYGAYRLYCDSIIHIAGSYAYLFDEIRFYTDGITTSQYAMSILGRYDYACDAVLANEEWAEAIEESEYWDSVLVDKVPYMTSATTPKGKATATVGTFDGAPYLVFGGGAWTPANNVSSGILYYDFEYPILIKKNVTFSYIKASGSPQTLNCKIVGSNDETNWTDISETVSVACGTSGDIPVDTEQYYRYIGLSFSGIIYKSGSFRGALKSLNFYGRHSSDKYIPLVPTMTSNTTPSGECIASEEFADVQYMAYKAFDGNDSTAWYVKSGSTTNQWIGYDFGEPVSVVKVKVRPAYASSASRLKNINIQYSDDGTTWNGNNNFVVPNVDQDNEYVLTDIGNHRYWRMFVADLYGGSNIGCATLQFYADAPTSILHSAPYDTIFYLVNNVETVLCTCDADGVAEVDWSTLDLGEIQLYSTTAKDPDNLSDEFGMTIRVTPNKVDAFVIPDKALYWWGYENPNLEDCTSTNGWSGGTFTSPTHNTTTISVSSAGSAVSGIGTKQKIASLSKVILIAKGLTATGNVYGSLLSESSKALTYGTYERAPISSSLGVVEWSVSANNTYIVSINGDGGRVFEVSAFLYE